MARYYGELFGYVVFSMVTAKWCFSEHVVFSLLYPKATRVHRGMECVTRVRGIHVRVAIHCGYLLPVHGGTALRAKNGTACYSQVVI